MILVDNTVCSTNELQACLEASAAQLPHSFVNAIAQIKTVALQDLDHAAKRQQLYYHDRTHVEGVQQRTNRIFQAVRPDWSTTTARLHLLLDLCAVVHDLIQVFVSQNQPNLSRRREAGISEAATIAKVLEYGQDVLGADDLALIQTAIAATICAYDPNEQSIYQPALYDTEACMIAQILAIADIGTLGMEGIAAFNREGSLLFLEENPDVIPTLATITIDQNPEGWESIRQRLLRRAQFQVKFARSRFDRFERETANFPAAIRSVFPYLTLETVEQIAQKTPTHPETSVETLIEFFDLKAIIRKLSENPS